MNHVLSCNGDSRGEAKVSDLNCRREGIRGNQGQRTWTIKLLKIFHLGIMHKKLEAGASGGGFAISFKEK